MSNNIFGLVEEIRIINGIPLVAKGGLTPKERVFLQENTQKAQYEFNQDYLAFVALVQKELKLESQYDAYALVKKYYDPEGNIDDKTSAVIEVLSLKEQFKPTKNVELDLTTYLLSERIVKEQFPVEEFKRVFGAEYTGEWTKEHTLAIGQILAPIQEFLNGEVNPEPSKKAGK